MEEAPLKGGRRWASLYPSQDWLHAAKIGRQKSQNNESSIHRKKVKLSKVEGSPHCSLQRRFGSQKNVAANFVA